MTLEENARKFRIPYFGLDDKRQGIVHIIGPEQGFTLPGTTIVCSDSHTSTHGAFGALAFGIGTSEAEHVLATQTLITRRSKNMRIQIDGALPDGVTAKDLILHIIGQVGIAGGTGCVVEYCGTTIQALSMEARMSICNMSIEAGARAGMIAPDATTFDYVRDRPLAPKYHSAEWDAGLKYWQTLYSDPGAKYDAEVFINADDVAPTVSWGTTPECVIPITGCVPKPGAFETQEKRESCQRMLEYMGLTAGMPLEGISVDKVFIGSCTNSRIEDLRAAANIVKGRKVSLNLKQALIVPGSGLVKKQAEKEGLDTIFLDAGFEWREAGCSMCLGMNPDILSPEERCASTSNRNFEGRQGTLSRTHLMSPTMAAAAAISGELTDVRRFSRRGERDTPTAQEYKVDTLFDSAKFDAEAPIKDIPVTPTHNLESSITGPLVTGGIPKFTHLKGIVAPLERSNIDTDTIIPKKFLTTIARTGLAKGCFFDLRFRLDGSQTDFILNKKPYSGAKILVVTGENFGCGSSREHAPWALLDFGIRCIIAPSFADIFFQNSFKNGMLPIAITNSFDLELIAAEARAGREIEVDLVNQTIRNAAGKYICGFEVDGFKKYCLVGGLDDIGLTMQVEHKITDFELHRENTAPWLHISAFSTSSGVRIDTKPVISSEADISMTAIEW